MGFRAVAPRSPTSGVEHALCHYGFASIFLHLTLSQRFIKFFYFLFCFAFSPPFTFPFIHKRFREIIYFILFSTIFRIFFSFLGGLHNTFFFLPVVNCIRNIARSAMHDWLKSSLQNHVSVFLIAAFRWRITDQVWNLFHEIASKRSGQKK